MCSAASFKFDAGLDEASLSQLKFAASLIQEALLSKLKEVLNEVEGKTVVSQGVSNPTSTSVSHHSPPVSPRSSSPRKVQKHYKQVCVFCVLPSPKGRSHGQRGRFASKNVCRRREDSRNFIDKSASKSRKEKIFFAYSL